MLPENALYIGGVLNGQFKKPVASKEIALVPIPKISVCVQRDDIPTSTVERKQHIYSLKRIRGDKKDFTLMIWDRITLDEAFWMLIKNSIKTNGN